MKANPPAPCLHRPVSPSGPPRRATLPGSGGLTRVLLMIGIMPLVGALSACTVPQATPPAVVTPPPKASAPVAAPVLPTDWRTAPLTPGDWRWGMEGSRSVARFAGTAAVLSCDPATRAVTLTVAGGTNALDAPASLTIATSSINRTLPAVRARDGLAVTLQGRDPLLDAMVFSRGRFAIEASGGPSLRVPSWPEIGRSVEDCR